MRPQPLDLAPPELERWWLVFTPPVEPGWWKVFITEDFGHVYAFRQVGPEIVLVLSPIVHRVENGIRPMRASELVEAALAEGHKVLVYTKPTRRYDPHTDVRVGRGWIITCASYLAYTLGIPFSWKCTPYQLFKAALKAGAEELHGRSSQAVLSTEAQEGQGGREAPGGAGAA